MQVGFTVAFTHQLNRKSNRLNPHPSLRDPILWLLSSLPGALRDNVVEQLKSAGSRATRTSPLDWGEPVISGWHAVVLVCKVPI